MSNTRENTLAALAAAAFLGLLAGEAAVSSDGWPGRSDRPAHSGDRFVMPRSERSPAPAVTAAPVRLAHHDTELPACAR